MNLAIDEEAYHAAVVVFSACVLVFVEVVLCVCVCLRASMFALIYTI